MKNILFIILLFPLLVFSQAKGSVSGGSSGFNVKVYKTCVTNIKKTGNASTLRNSFVISCLDSSTYFIDRDGVALRCYVPSTGGGGDVVTDGTIIVGNGTALNPVTITNLPINKLLPPPLIKSGEVLVWNGTGFVAFTISSDLDFVKVAKDTSPALNEPAFRRGKLLLGGRKIVRNGSKITQLSVIDSINGDYPATIYGQGLRGSGVSFSNTLNKSYINLSLQGSTGVIGSPVGTNIDFRSFNVSLDTFAGISTPFSLPPFPIARVNTTNNTFDLPLLSNAQFLRTNSGGGITSGAFGSGLIYVGGILSATTQPSLYSASGTLKDTLEALSSNGRAIVARNSGYPVRGGGNITGFVSGKTTGNRIRLGVLENLDEIRSEAFSSTVTSTHSTDLLGYRYRFTKGTTNNIFDFSENELLYQFSNSFSGSVSKVSLTDGKTSISANGGTSLVELQSDTVSSKTNSFKFKDENNFDLMTVKSEGYAQYSQNVQDSILANDRRLLDVGSLKRYLILNPVAPTATRSWNRNGNTGTGLDTLGTTGNFPLNFYTNATKRMEVTKDGKIALGLNSFNGNQGAIYTNFSPTAKTYTGFGTGHWVNSSALPAIVLDNNTASTGKQVFTIQAQTAGRTTFEYRNDNGTGSPTGSANILVLSPNTASSSKPSIGLNVAAPSSTLDVDGTIAFRANNITQAAAGTINALLSVDVASTLGVTYNGVVDGLVTFPTPTITTAKYMTVINTGTTDFLMYNTHLRAVNGKRSGNFMFNSSSLSWEPMTIRPWASTTALGTNTAVAANTVVDNILSVNLPVAGTYELRGIIQGTISAWADGDVEIRLGSGVSTDANSVGMMKVFSQGTNTRMALSFVKRVTVASATNIVLSVNNRQETQALTILSNASATGQGTSIYAEKID